MQKNIASQKIVLLAIDTSTNAPKTGDAANLTAYVSKDWGAVTVLGDTTATELDATNAPGLYSFDLTQAETNADELIFSGKSATANIKLIPRIVQTVPGSFSTLTIANSCVDADVERFAGTAGTFSGGRPEVNVSHVAGTAAQAASGRFQVDVELWNGTAVPAEHTAGYPIVTIKDGTGTGEINTNAGAIALVDLVTTTTTVTNQLTAAAIATGVWQDATAGDFTVASSIGKALYIANIAPGASGGHFISGSNAGTTTVGALTVTAALTAGTNAIPWNAAYDAEVQSEVEDAIVVHRLDELLNADSDIDGAAPPTVGSVFHELMSKTAGSFTFDQTTDSNEAIRDRGDAAWITATGFSTHSAADVWASATRTLTAATNITSTGGTTVPQTGDSFARIGAAGAGLTAVPWNPSWDAEVQSEVIDALQETIPDSIPADGTRPSVQSSLYMICQGLFEGSISGTTWTVKKVDGSTSLFTVTLDSSTTPTSKTRAT